MAAITYDGNAIIPAPFVSIGKVYQKSPDGSILGTLFSLTLTGKIFPYKGSPKSDGTFWTLSGYPPDEVKTDDQMLAAINAKQEALRRLFADEGKQLLIQPWDGSSPLQCNPRDISIEFAGGLWYNDLDYTINLQCDQILGLINSSDEDNLTVYISDAAESWQIELNENVPENEFQQQTFRISHTVSAVGKKFYNTDGTVTLQAWQQAQAYVLPRLGMDLTRLAAPSSLNVPSYLTGFNQVRAETVDERGGSYSVTESWLASSGSALEEFTISVQSGIQDGLVHVGIQGTINGLEVRNSGYAIQTTKYTNATTKWNTVQSQLLSRAQTYGGITLNPIPVTQNIGKNPVHGVYNYNVEFNNRPTYLVAGAKSEVITIHDAGGTDVVARVGILGRAAGPILQPIGTVTETTRSLNVEVVMPVVSTNTFQAWSGGAPDYTPIINIAKPQANQVYMTEFSKSFNPRDGHGSLQLTWLYQ